MTAVVEEVQRDRYGRYLILNGNGAAKPYTRATTIASTLSDSFGLTNWKLRTLAVGLATRDDIYARIAAVDPNDKKTLDRLCQDALEAGRSSAGANFGTALHEAVARINRGETVTMPAPWNADLDIYRKTLERAGVVVQPEYVERVVVLDEPRVAGTFDAVVTLADGTSAIADLKTGQNLDYSWHEIAIQLSLYAAADSIYSPQTGFRHDMPSVRSDIGLIIHLPAGQGRCALHTIDLKAGWEAARLALDVRAWRSQKGLAHAYVPAGDHQPPTGAADAIRSRVEKIRDAGHLPALAAAWPHEVPTFKSGHAHTRVELELIARTVTAVEAETGMPF